MATQRKAQQDDASAFLHVRVAPEALHRFRALAQAEHRTVSQDIRHYIDRRIAEADALEQAA